MIVFVSCAPSQVRAWLIVGGATPFIRLFQASAVDGSTLEGLLARHGHTQVEPPCVSGLRYASPGQALSVCIAVGCSGRLECVHGFKPRC